MPPYFNSGMPPPGMFPGAMPTGMPGMPGAMFGQPPITSYPQGQGPLADRPVQVGANGLYVAPEPEGPEEHGMLQLLCDLCAGGTRVRFL